MLDKINNIPRLYLWISVFVITALALGVAYFLTMPGSPKAQLTVKPSEQEPESEPEPTIYYSPLSGKVVTEAETKRVVTGVMIENSTTARPQSGLSEAGIIYEAIAEGGITRFLAIFQEGRPSSLGPVRSARPYYVEWLAPYKASYAHVGGSDQGLAEARQYLPKDIDQFNNSSAYYRISERSAPHNMYTNFDLLDGLNAQKNNTYEAFVPWLRKDDQPITPTAAQVSMSISSATFNPVYNYDVASNSYLRTHSGTPHTDANTGAQLAPKVVIAMQVSNSSGAKYWNYDNIGTGKVWIFQDGGVTEGTWSKPSITADIKLTDTNGKDIALNRGLTWVSAVKSVTY